MPFRGFEPRSMKKIHLFYLGRFLDSSEAQKSFKFCCIEFHFWRNNVKVDSRAIFFIIPLSGGAQNKPKLMKYYFPKSVFETLKIFIQF